VQLYLQSESLTLTASTLVHPRFSVTCELSELGVLLWRLLEQPKTLDQLCAVVVREYDVVPMVAENAISGFLEELRGLGFVKVRYTNFGVDPMRQRYLELLKKALVNLLYPEHELRIRQLLQEKPTSQLESDRLLRDIRRLQPEHFEEVVASKMNGAVLYGEVTRYSHTAVGLRRLENLEACAEAVFADGIAGDFLEAGVCQGGASIFMRALQVAYSQPERQMWLADSFEGLPAPTAEADVLHNLDWSESKQPWLAIDLDTVKEHFRRYDLLSDSVHFLQGWFADTLPVAPIEQLAILRLDGDLYSSTLDVLEGLYHKVTKGGFVIVDDYHALKPCRDAVDYFRQQHNMLEPLHRVDWSCVYWRKTQ
jgi:hypothetical protein